MTCDQVVTSVQTVLTCSKLISPQAMSQVIRFLYTGRIDSQIINMGALKQVSEQNISANLDPILTSLCAPGSRVSGPGRSRPLP